MLATILTNRLKKRNSSTDSTGFHARSLSWALSIMYQLFNSSVDSWLLLGSLLATTHIYMKLWGFTRPGLWSHLLWYFLSDPPQAKTPHLSQPVSLLQNGAINTFIAEITGVLERSEDRMHLKHFSLCVGANQNPQPLRGILCFPKHPCRNLKIHQKEF